MDINLRNLRQMFHLLFYIVEACIMHCIKYRDMNYNYNNYFTIIIIIIHVVNYF